MRRMSEGAVVSIHVAAEASAPIQSFTEVRAFSGSGPIGRSRPLSFRVFIAKFSVVSIVALGRKKRREIPGARTICK